MSRSVARKKQPASKSKRRDSNTSTSSYNFSTDDEDGYSAVDEISDDEDLDDDDVNAVEEEAIVTQAYQLPVVAPRPPLVDPDHDNEEDDDDNAYDANDDDLSSSIAANDDREESTSWAGIMSEREDENISDFFDDAVHEEYYGAKHVRFDLPAAHSDSDSTDSEDDYGGIYSDIFVDQNALDPAFRREVEGDPDESSGSGSFWDYGDNQDSDVEEVVRDMMGVTTPTPLAAAKGHSEKQSVDALYVPEPVDDLDGYETDGDTTDEEEFPDPPIRRKTRRPSIPKSEVSDSEFETPRKWQRDRPRVGHFSLDKHKKPTVVLNPVTRKMMIFTPQNRHHIDLSPEQFQAIPMLPLGPESPMFSNPGHMMFSAMFAHNSFADFVNGQAIGPAEAFFGDLNAEDESEDSFASQNRGFDGDDMGQEDDEQCLDINDFISFDSDSSSEDEGVEKEFEPESTPVRPSTSSGAAAPLGHLNSHTVGAFRRNQVNQQLILSTQATQDSLDFSGPYNHTAIRGLKADRFDVAGGQPLTPVRRRKNTLTEVTRSPLEVASTKRKASNSDLNGAGHKRQRSISDVNMLAI